MVVLLHNGQLFKNISKLKHSLQYILNRPATTSSSRSAEAIFIEKSLEQPIIAVTDTDNVDLIGPPDPISNLRPIVRKRYFHETVLQEKLRLMQDETHAWNQIFWAEHNTRFIKERKEFVSGKKIELGEEMILTADEMSEFYKKFLDQNWRTHVNYNIQWYKRNFTLLFLALRANLPPSVHNFM